MSEITLPPLEEQHQKLVLVTGAASGIGLATAQLFAQHGAKVILVDLPTTRLKSVAEKIGHGCDYRACDVSSWEQQVALFDWVTQIHGRPEVVCLNAGIDPEIETWFSAAAKENVVSNYFANEHDFLAGPSGGQEQLKPPPKTMFDVNFYGVLYGLKLAIHHFEKGKKGRVVMTGSAASQIPFEGHDVYGATKHALLGLMRNTTQRPELKDNDIAVAMIAPWLTFTGLTTRMTPELLDRFANETSQPQDVARGIAYLATANSAAEVTGTCLWVRGQRYIEVEKAYAQWLGTMIAV